MVVVVVVVAGEWPVWRGGLANLDLASGWPVRCLIKLTGEWWVYQVKWRYVVGVERSVTLGLS